VEATLVSVSLFTGVVAVEGCLGGGVSDLEGLTPLIVSIPSTVTVFPAGNFSPLVPEQEVKRKKNAANRTKAPNIFLLCRIVDTPYLLSFGEPVGKYIINFIEVAKSHGQDLKES